MDCEATRILFGSSSITTSLTQTAQGRIFLIDPFREFEVKPETRMVLVGFEDRDYTIDTENRVNNVDNEIRTFQIPSETREFEVQHLTLVRQTPRGRNDRRSG